MFPVFMLTVYTIIFIERNGGLHTIWRTGDIDAFLALSFWGLIVFIFVSRLLLVFEKIKHPTVINHIEHSSILYVLFLIFLYQLFPYTGSGMESALPFLFTMIIFAAIVINFVVLFLKRERHEYKK